MGGTKTKRGKSGNAAQYLTRNQAIKKLQLRLSEFRRLCILKGIHPREPKKKTKGANKTYYHVKDINWLLHEPLLKTFRDLKAYDRKVRKARAKQNLALAQRLLSRKPGYRLDALVRERYPSFLDALRDLDDSLTLTHLFAVLPAEQRYDIPVKVVEASRRLVMEWQAYVVRSAALRKVFVSVKGFYYQAEVLGQPITWLVPHGLAQVLPPDVDYKVMLTFLEFYTTLLQFVHFKLYHGLGLAYPPMLDPKLEQAAAGLAAIMRDLAGMRETVEGQQQQQRQQQLQQGQQGEQGQKQNGSAEDGAADAADVVQRLGTLAKRIRQIEAEQASTAGPAAAAVAADAAEAGSEDDDDEDGALEIDSGDDEVSEEEGEEGEADSEDEDEEGVSDDDDMQDEEEQEAGQDGTNLELSASERAGGEPSTSGADGARAAGGSLGVDASDESAVCGSLLKGLVFFLAREVPREPLLFVIRAFGGVAAWDGEGSPYTEEDEAITHQVVDRPTQGHKFLSREYIQPQWVFDSANFRVLMPAELYAPGKAPPPHLSPFVDSEEEGYTPDWLRQVRALQEAARSARERAAGIASDRTFLEGDNEDGARTGAGQLPSGAADAVDLETAEKVYIEELAQEVRAAQGQTAEEEEEGEEEGQEQQEQQQVVPAASKKRVAAEMAPDEELNAMKDIMMSRKNRKLYERINRAREGKAERVSVLEQRKQALGKGGKKQ